MKRVISICIFISMVIVGNSQTSQADSLRRDSIRRANQAAIQKATQEDYKAMLATLGIDSTRRGPSGNPSAPNAANTDESKVNPNIKLPDPLVLKNGKKNNR